MLVLIRHGARKLGFASDLLKSSRVLMSPRKSADTSTMTLPQSKTQSLFWACGDNWCWCCYCSRSFEEGDRMKVLQTIKASALQRRMSNGLGSSRCRSKHEESISLNGLMEHDDGRLDWIDRGWISIRGEKRSAWTPKQKVFDNFEAARWSSRSKKRVPHPLMREEIVESVLKLIDWLLFEKTKAVSSSLKIAIPSNWGVDKDGRAWETWKTVLRGRFDVLLSWTTISRWFQFLSSLFELRREKKTLWVERKFERK